MKKILFKDRPDRSTPISAANLNLLQNNVEEEIYSRYKAYIPVNITVGQSSVFQVSPAIEGVELYVKLGNNEYFSNVIVYKQQLGNWQLIKDHINQSVLFRVTGNRHIELFEGSAKGSAIVAYREIIGGGGS